MNKDTMQSFSIVYISSDQILDNKVVYHAKWKIDDTEGFTICIGNDIEKCFQDVQKKAYDEARASVESTVPFGKFKGLGIENAPIDFVRRWACKRTEDFDDDKTVRFINVCKSLMEG